MGRKCAFCLMRTTFTFSPTGNFFLFPVNTSTQLPRFPIIYTLTCTIPAFFLPLCPLCPLWVKKIFFKFAARQIFNESINSTHSPFLLVNKLPGPKSCSPGSFALVSFFPGLVSTSPAFTSYSWILWFSSSSLFRISFRARGEMV